MFVYIIFQQRRLFFVWHKNYITHTHKNRKEMQKNERTLNPSSEIKNKYWARIEEEFSKEICCVNTE